MDTSVDPIPPTPPFGGGGGGGGDSSSSAPAPVVPKPDGGTVTLTPANPKPGQDVTVHPKPEAGNKVDKVVVTGSNGKDVPVTKKTDGNYTFTQPKTGVTVTVTFKPVGDLPFTDVAASDWYYDSVKYVYDNGLMNGMTADIFSPHAEISRGMIATILWRLTGAPTVKGASLFTDVSADSTHAVAIAWGAENGIVKGFADGKFNPNATVTREQLAAFLHRYAQFKGMDTAAKGDLSRFTDQPSIWAAESVQWAVGDGIISGRSNGTLDTLARATRAEAAVILTRFAVHSAK